MSVAIVLLVDRLVGLQAVTWGAGRQ
jgi:hypothetical protein